MKTIDEMTIGEFKRLAEMFSAGQTENEVIHPMLGRRVLVRTYSAGVHIGMLTYINGTEAKLVNGFRLWSWNGGGLSLSAVATNGIKGGRLNRTPEVYLTEVIEIIPTTEKAESTYAKFVED